LGGVELRETFRDGNPCPEGTNQHVDGNRQGLDDYADEVVGRGDATDGEVDTEFDTVGAAGLGRKGFVEGCATGLDKERCPVTPGMKAIGGNW
jgi:hypothetical protein